MKCTGEKAENDALNQLSFGLKEVQLRKLFALWTADITESRGPRYFSPWQWRKEEASLKRSAGVGSWHQWLLVGR